MEMSGEYRIDAPRERVWDALNDPEVLKECIPGCESMERTADNEFTAKVKAKVGPVSARFAGTVTLSDLNPPESYRISGEGKGGAAGFAKGGATVKLSEDGGQTVLGYEAEGQVGGKLAQVGARLVDGTAKKMADGFFSKFAETVEQPSEAAPAEAATPAAATDEAAPAEPVPEAAAPAPEPTPPKAEPAPKVEKDISFPERSPEGEGTKKGVWVVGAIVAAVVIIAILILG
ncbi:MAG: carbon monoxide dehydrogenase subunit G [Acidobacteriota bacterium]